MISAGTGALVQGQGGPANSGVPVSLSIAPRAFHLPAVTTAAAEALGTEQDPGALATQVNAIYDSEFGLLEITGYASQPRLAENIAVAFGDALIAWLTDVRNAGLDNQITIAKETRKDLQQAGAPAEALEQYDTQIQIAEIAKLQSLDLITIQEPVATEVPIAGFRPPQSRTTRALIAGFLGLLAGIVLALILERFDTRIRTRQKAEQHFELPVLSEVPLIGRHDRDKVTVVSNPTGKAADAFRLLASSVAGAWAAQQAARATGERGRPASLPKTLLITSAGAGDGKTTVASNLAAVYGELGKRVTVISCDLRRPTIHRAFGLPVQPGLSELIVSGNGTRPAPFETGIPNVRVLPSGAAPVSPGELLGSERMLQVLRDAQRDADIVILDCSPLLVASDVAPLLPHVDAVLLVSRAGKTRWELAERTADVLRRLQAPVVGVALNGAREISMPNQYRRYYKPAPDAPRLVVARPPSPTTTIPDPASTGASKERDRG
jgi:capsular exopolysaccharide synthesis family protein